MTFDEECAPCPLKWAYSGVRASGTGCSGTATGTATGSATGVPTLVSGVGDAYGVPGDEQALRVARHMNDFALGLIVVSLLASMASARAT